MNIVEHVNCIHTYVLSLLLNSGEFLDEKRGLDKVLKECFKHVTLYNHVLSLVFNSEEFLDVLLSSFIVSLY